MICALELTVLAIAVTVFSWYVSSGVNSDASTDSFVSEWSEGSDFWGVGLEDILLEEFSS